MGAKVPVPAPCPLAEGVVRAKKLIDLSRVVTSVIYLDRSGVERRWSASLRLSILEKR
jgi:hypothetical protein